MPPSSLDHVKTRRVAPADRAALRGVLARAFADDPVINWVFTRDASRPKRASQFFDWELRRLVLQGLSWTTEGCQGAALWSPPGRWRETPREALGLALLMAPTVHVRAAQVLTGLARVEHAHPRTPHVYLSILGVDSGLQGTGIGSRLLAPGLNHCDAAALPAYLETATERNLEFYERQGFAITGEVRIRRGPRVWTMWREPQDPAA